MVLDQSGFRSRSTSVENPGSQAALRVVMYHYVRDPQPSAYPRLKALDVESFHKQVTSLSKQHEMATLHDVIEFLKGRSNPKQSLCLLTFDDGLREHFTTVAPLLAERNIQGIFFPITQCLQEGCMAPVHMNHLLMARLDFNDYVRRFMECLRDLYPNLTVPKTSPDVVAATYRWDTPAVAAFKYLFNFALTAQIRDRVVRTLFEAAVGNEQEIAREFYCDWNCLRAMQEMGMVMGGHSHEHRPLSSLSDEELHSDLSNCQSLLRGNLHPQSLWPFSFPYGKASSIHAKALTLLRQLGFDCAMTTESGDNPPGSWLYTIMRRDCVEPIVNGR